VPRAIAIERVRGVENAELEQLPRIVPLVERVPDVKAFVALQANEIGVQRRRGRCRQRRLADAGFAFEKQRTLQAERQEQGERKPAIGDVLLGGKALLQLGNGGGMDGDNLSRECGDLAIW
jgi:hypothetical protein